MRSRGADKDSRALVSWAEREGFSVTRNKRGRLQFKHPDIPRVLITASRTRMEGDHKPMQILRTALSRARASDQTE